MEDRGKWERPSPLRNSKAANRPFQSPLRSALNQTAESRSKNLNPSPRDLTTPERRIRSQPYLLPKKICQESEPRVESKLDKEESIDEDDLKKLKERISRKKKELEHLKQQSLYAKKHESQDLKDLSERWLRGCQEALSQFQKDISRNSGANVSMNEILTQLGIPTDLVKYSDEECDFV